MTRRHLLSLVCASPALADEQLTRLALSPRSRTDAQGLRVAVVVGHNSEQPGARGQGPIELCEFPYWAESAACLIEALKFFGCEAQVLHRQSANSYAKEIRECYARVSEIEPHAVIELHFNDAGRSAPYGSITLHAGGAKSAVLAEACQTGMENALSWGETDRRLSPWSRVEYRRGGRGYAALKACSAPTVILEPAFAGSNATEAELLYAFGEQMLWAVGHQVALAAVPLKA